MDKVIASSDHRLRSDSLVMKLLFDQNVEGSDICSQCDEKKNIVTCNKCGEAVCCRGECANLFPHHNDTLYVVCNECTDEIARKLRLVIDFGKLKLLKRKLLYRGFHS